MLWYGFHSSALRYAAFVRAELKAQNAMGHIVVLPWEDVRDLSGLWISPLGLITQEGHRPRLIYDYMRSSRNVAVLYQAPTEAMQFSQTVPRLLHTIIHAGLWGGTI